MQAEAGMIRIVNTDGGWRVGSVFTPDFWTSPVTGDVLVEAIRQFVRSVRAGVVSMGYRACFPSGALTAARAVAASEWWPCQMFLVTPIRCTSGRTSPRRGPEAVNAAGALPWIAPPRQGGRKRWRDPALTEEREAVLRLQSRPGRARWCGAPSRRRRRPRGWPP
jgi:hypothetical protein